MKAGSGRLFCFWEPVPPGPQGMKPPPFTWIVWPVM